MNRTELIIPLDSTQDYSSSNLIHKGESMVLTSDWLKNLFEDVYEGGREAFSKGGEVDVPQAPIEPDERIDKMTGLPYDLQAGGAFIDEEDREGFSIGSKVLNKAIKAARKNTTLTNKPKTITRDKDLELLSRDFIALADGFDVNQEELNATFKRIRNRLEKNDGMLGEPPQKMDKDLENTKGFLPEIDEVTKIASEKRMLSNKGGKVLKSLERTCKQEGGLTVKTTAGKILNSLKGLLI
jgi:hypothetical protein